MISQIYSLKNYLKNAGLFFILKFPNEYKTYPDLNRSTKFRALISKKDFLGMTSINRFSIMNPLFEVHFSESGINYVLYTNEIKASLRNFKDKLLC